MNTIFDQKDVWLALVMLPLMVLLAACLSSLMPQHCFDMDGNPCRVEAQP